MVIPLCSRASRGLSLWPCLFLITPERTEQMLLFYSGVSISQACEGAYAKQTGEYGRPSFPQPPSLRFTANNKCLTKFLIKPNYISSGNTDLVMRVFMITNVKKRKENNMTLRAESPKSSSNTYCGYSIVQLSKYDTFNKIGWFLAHVFLTL